MRGETQDPPRPSVKPVPGRGVTRCSFRGADPPAALYRDLPPPARQSPWRMSDGGDRGDRGDPVGQEGQVKAERRSPLVSGGGPPSRVEVDQPVWRRTEELVSPCGLVDMGISWPLSAVERRRYQRAPPPKHPARGPRRGGIGSADGLERRKFTEGASLTRGQTGSGGGDSLERLTGRGGAIAGGGYKGWRGGEGLERHEVARGWCGGR